MACAKCGESGYRGHFCDNCGMFYCERCVTPGYSCPSCSNGKIREK